jgi:hypothetical protein
MTASLLALHLLGHSWSAPVACAGGVRWRRTWRLVYRPSHRGKLPATEWQRLPQQRWQPQRRCCLILPLSQICRDDGKMTVMEIDNRIEYTKHPPGVVRFLALPKKQICPQEGDHVICLHHRATHHRKGTKLPSSLTHAILTRILVGSNVREVDFLLEFCVH